MTSGLMFEVWCEGCRDWYPVGSVHALQFRRRSNHRYPRRVRLSQLTANRGSTVPDPYARL